MNRVATLLSVPLLALLIGCREIPPQETLTYADLVNRLIDLERLATLPAAGETCRQWSSWDRASQYDAATDKYVRWDANGDGGHVIRQEGEQSVLAEMDGPGCIWRIWSARGARRARQDLSGRSGATGGGSAVQEIISPAMRLPSLTPRSRTT